MAPGLTQARKAQAEFITTERSTELCHGTYKEILGHELPAVGLGTWQGRAETNDETALVESIVHALKSGYRLIDTAQMYGVESIVGKAVRASGIPRSEITVVTKFWGYWHHDPAEALRISLRDLDLEYVDMFLMHWPWAQTPDRKPLRIHESPTFAETWKLMEQLVGPKCRGIGVSNFTQKTLDTLLETASIVPVVNQIELHALNPNLKLVPYCQSKGIHVMSWRTIGARDDVLTHELFTNIAKAHGCSSAVASLSWAVQRGVTVIPKSSNKSRIEENIKLVTLTEGEVASINKAHETLGKQSGIGGAGRGLFARRDFPPGDLILSLDRPLVAEVEMVRMLDTCAWCFQRSELDPEGRKHAASMGLPVGFIEVKACTGCRRVVYCSKTCQSRAWKREHKYECKVIAPKERPDLPSGVRAVIKLLGRLKADPEDERILAISKFRPAGEAGGLEALSQQNREKFGEFQILALGVYKYTGEPKIAGSDSQALTKSLLFNIMSNAFELGSPLDGAEGGNLGIGFDPFLCNANHSCEPNATLVFNQPQTLLRALKHIKKGEEILMRYVEETNPFSVRQAELRENYYFSCQCPKCKKGAKFQEDVFATRPEELSAEYRKIADDLITRHEANLHKFFVPANDETAQRRLAALQAEAFSVSRRSTGYADEEEVKAALKMCINSGMWTWTRQPVPELCRQLFGLYIASGNPHRAFRLGLKRHFEIMSKLHPEPFYPSRLIDLWAMSTVTNVLCGPMHQAIYDEFAQSGVSLRTVYFGFLLDLRDNLPKMYGMESPFGRLVEQTYTQLMANIGTSEAKIRELVKEVWPALEIIARKVDIEDL
ncbi:hypothetical protein DL766_001527 [Monosporascus sp. MC13-8B]|uniref:Suppressor of anucleate metulae protein B n=1 Tax=Monosporascus cannonballus TaxID=155416 RepID=A0ABY0HJB2_9PEZI|nr:hypothetical protein DL763_007330 [Monosporascus cannonballus]RYO93764.1 hypothetical protein DL762_000969 [Monosporascus cannonballus]RYP37376.1 hypothetical protein DL766_001527 [Monosporascus sp. MC13-8B]